jgi:hypothetical protein
MWPDGIVLRFNAVSGNKMWISDPTRSHHPIFYQLMNNCREGLKIFLLKLLWLGIVK